MRKLWMLARANIRKTKSVSITLAAMFLIAALLLNIGLLVVINYGSYYNKIKEELLPSDAYIMLPDTLYSQTALDYLNSNDHIKNLQLSQNMILDAKVDYDGSEHRFSLLFKNMDEQAEKNKWKFVGEHNTPGETSVYLPDIFKAVGGYQLGDTIEIRYTDEQKQPLTLSFTVSGYIEDIFFSSTDTGMLGFYLPEQAYRQLEQTLADPTFHAHIFFMDVDDIKNFDGIENGLRDTLDLHSASLMTDISSLLLAISLELVDTSRCMMASVVSAMLVLFALIIAAVCLLVVRFRITGSLEEDQMKIGSLQSVGYTSRQIILSILMQFSLIAGLGSILGIALSYPVLPVISTIFEQQSGLRWTQGFDGIISGCAFLALLLFVVIITLAAARKVKRVSPIHALRGESATRRAVKNRLPLEAARGRLPALLAIKNMLQNSKQSMMIMVIIISVTFAGAFGVIMYYNTAVDTRAFAEVPGMEVCNAIAVLNPEMEHGQAVEQINAMEHVRKTFYFDEVKLKIDGQDASAYIMKDYSLKESRLVYDGQYPSQRGEIALAGLLAKRLDKTVGDKITLQVGDKTAEFSIVGLSNGSSMGGINSSILYSDYMELKPDFQPQTLNIYLDKGTDAAAFIEKLKQNIDPELLLTTINFDKEMADGMASFQNIVKLMGVAMLLITLAVVALVLYFMINSTVIRKKKELGIQKAIGFTTFQLMNQISLGFALPIIIGAVIGSWAGAVFTNPMMSFSMQSMGIMKAGFIVDSLYVIAFGAATVLFSYLLALFITWKVRKISAYRLVTE